MRNMKNIPDLSLVLACYNEAPVFEKSVERIIDTLLLSRLSFELIFVDDKSSDKTPRLITKACKKYPRCYPLFHRNNCGRGKTVADGIRIAKGKAVGYIDIDLEVSPVYISEMVQMILSDKADVVIGKRIYRTTFVSIPREISSLIYRSLADSMVGTGRLDTETGYKFFNRKKILKILPMIRHRHWFWDTEIIVQAKLSGLRIREVPVLYTRRFDKKSTVRVLSDSLDYLISLWRLRKRLATTKKL